MLSSADVGTQLLQLAQRAATHPYGAAATSSTAGYYGHVQLVSVGSALLTSLLIPKRDRIPFSNLINWLVSSNNNINNSFQTNSSSTLSMSIFTLDRLNVAGGRKSTISLCIAGS